MKALAAFTIVGLITSASHACALYSAHSPLEVGTVENGKVVSTAFGAVGELRGSEVYSYSKGIIGHIVGHKVEKADGSFAAFVAGHQILNINRQNVAFATMCSPAEAGAAYLLLF